MVVAASVVIGSLIAGTTWLFNPNNSPNPAPNILVPFNDAVPWKANMPGPRPSPDLATPLDGKPIVVSLRLPAYRPQSSPDTARYEFVVRLSNTGDAPISLERCPFYRVQFVKDVETGYLNCDEAPDAIPAAGHVDFAMEAPAHDAELLARGGGTGFGLLWQLGTEGAEGMTARGRAQPTESSGPVKLEGEWKVTELTNRAGRSLLTGRFVTAVRMKFSQGKVTGSTGCNDVFADYKQSGIDGRFLTFPNGEGFGSTLAACTNEPPLMTRLLEVRYVSEWDGVLYLRGASGPTIAVLERANE